MEETTSQNHRDSADETNVSFQINMNSSPNGDANKTPEESELNNTINTKSSEALPKALSCMLTSVIKDFDSKAQDTLQSQDQLASAIDRLTRELDQLLEDAPLPFIMQHAAKISSVRKRVSSLNSLLRSIQQRIDNVDRMLSAGIHHEKTTRENS
ncbi:uncharacterized protein LOC116126687 [Pistacia vera]|uniref:uncharacterized protein LOC116126687 n=1 Tax=Pistacia vera TaxID=55513 RepID=UPI001262B98B|nr:uncharacterized protein LOC116126687 [Pistacia vera]XP_031268227.1 uncharacterized protein LOC116126687 [Pistacia vera]